MTNSQFFEQVEELHHDWRYDSPRVLYSLIRMLRPNVVVEVGTYRGYGASYMARALMENGVGALYCIDNFSLTDHEHRYGNAKQHLKDNLAKLGLLDSVTLIEGDSDKVEWPDNIDFAYIDGWHSYLAAKHDFWRCNRSASCICFDDTIQSVGPRLLMEEIREDPRWEMITLPCTCGMTIAMRKRPLAPSRSRRSFRTILELTCKRLQRTSNYGTLMRHSQLTTWSTKRSCHSYAKGGTRETSESRRGK